MTQVLYQVLDYSAGYPGARNIAHAGYPGGLRYLRKEGTSSVRPLTAGETADYAAYGLELGLIYQHVSKTRVLEGRAAGRHDAEWALNRANESGVVPRAIYFAVDFDTISVSQWAAIREYLLGAAEILGAHRVGCYGEYYLLDYLFTRESIAWGWQTYAWSTGHNRDDQDRHPRAHLFQRLQRVSVGGVDCDVNDVLKPDYGQTPAPTPEDDMSWIEEIENPHVADPQRPGHGVSAQAKDVLWEGTDAAQAALAGVQRLEQMVAALGTPTVDYEKLAALVVAGLGPSVGVAVADELDRRARDGDPTTGPTT